MKKYRDRKGKTLGQNLNWTHIYNDGAQLKAPHGIRLQEKSKNPVKKDIPLALLNLYFYLNNTKREAEPPNSNYSSGA